MGSDYVELHAHSGFSFMDGASSPDELAFAAADLGYRAFALTDHDGVWGSMEFSVACRAAGITCLTGTELTVTTDAGPAHLTLLVADRTGYGNLCRLLTEAHAGTRDGPGRIASRPSLPLASLEGRTEGVLCLTGCASRGLVAGAWADRRPGNGEAMARRLIEWFGPENVWIEIQRPFWRNDRARNEWLEALGRRLGLPLVATGNVHSHTMGRARLQDVLVAARAGLGLDESEPIRRGNSSSSLVGPEEMLERFRGFEAAVTETVRVAERLDFDPSRDLGYRYPGAEDPNADGDLAELCRIRFRERYAGTGREVEAGRRLEEELGLIRGLGLSGFFLLHHDLLELAREVAVEVRGRDSARAVLPPGRGRGSSVSSVVCYLTGLSHVDPVEAGLFVGRFLNEEVTAMPDIDLDFPRDIRKALIPRIHERYGHDRSALVAAFPTYRMRGAVREFGKVFGLPAGEIERVARALGGYGSEEVEGDLASLIGRDRACSPGWQNVLGLAREARGLPRHPSQHSGGMIVSTSPLVEICPVVPAAMEGRQVVQWDKDSCADAGFLKIDLLGLGMLSAVERCVVEVERVHGLRLDLSRIDLEDRDTFEAIRRAETTGVFQIESRAQMQLLPRLLPRNLDDLTTQVALVRPGPIQGGAVHPFVERRRLLREDPGFEVPYEHPLLEPALGETLGVIVFQEQVIEVAMDVAGFTSSQAEGLRRAMSKKRSREAIMAHRRAFIEGAVGNGLEAGVASRIFESVAAFSGFGFPKSHSAAFALLAYQSAWLKVHYPAEFLASLLNEQPMGFYSPDSLVQEAIRSGIEILPPDVNHSDLDCIAFCPTPGIDIEGDDEGRHGPPDARRGEATGPRTAVRIGLGSIRDLNEGHAKKIVEGRESTGPFRSVPDLASRTGISRGSLQTLAWAGALRSLPGGTRSSALWTTGIPGIVDGPNGQMALPIDQESPARIREPGPWPTVEAEYSTTGLSLERHPMDLIRPRLEPSISTLSEALEGRDGSRIRVAGMVTTRQSPPTAKGTVFLLLEDETGVLNLIVPRWRAEGCRKELRASLLVIASGRIERRSSVTNLLVEELVDLAPPPGSFRTIAPKPNHYGNGRR